jgi:hypothetical protein
MFTYNSNSTSCPISHDDIARSAEKANHYLTKIPDILGSNANQFYSALNQRNISGFVGEVLKHSIHATNPDFFPNPHPDGRPDLLNLSSTLVRQRFEQFCYDPVTLRPIREHLAPFMYGGVEIKCTVGDTPNGSSYKIGRPRQSVITNLTYWAHHAHACDLLGCYYDFCPDVNGSPQIKAIFFANLDQSDWNKVSTGKAERKKTSNTSTNSSGKTKVKSGCLMYHNSHRDCLIRIGVNIS